jgi:SAM-dependent methyltransferase
MKQDLMKPGFCQEPEIENARITNMRAKKILQFISDLKNNHPAADVGSYNVMSILLQKNMNIPITQLTSTDFNFNAIESNDVYKKFKLIFCLEVLEHLQNPLFFIQNLKEYLDDDGVLILSSPSRPKFFYTPFHYLEQSPKHLQKWILTPLGLKIIRHKRLWYYKHWTIFLIGFRPLLRCFKTGLKPLVQSFYNCSIIYEIRKEKS